MYGASGVRYGLDASTEPPTPNSARSLMGLLAREAGRFTGRAAEAIETEVAQGENRRFREARLRSGNALLGEYSGAARKLYNTHRLDNSEDARSIRLIWVYGGQNGSPPTSYVKRAGMGLDCRVQTVSLRQNPRYVAVSYTWGSEPADHFVRINKSDVPVTRSCYQVLSEMPRIAFGYHVWIDQICVDQANSAEKGLQIQLMGTIFAQAAGVIVWLGDSSDAMPATSVPQSLGSTQIAPAPGIKLLYHLQQLSITFPSIGQTADDLVADTAPILSNLEAWKELGEIFSRPYFRRRWIIQEIAASKSTSLVFRGHLISWSVLWDTAERLFHFVGKQSTVFGKSVDFELFFSIHRQSYKSMDVIRAIDSLSRRIKARQQVNLLSLLDGFRNSEATNPRDCFHAFRSICGSAEALPAPDYSASIRDTFQSYAIFYIERGQGARILQCAGLCNNQEMPDSWSTWCPKWSFEKERQGDRKPFAHLNTGDTFPFNNPAWERLLNAGGSLAADIKYIGDGQLKAYGRVVGKIAFLLKHGIQDGGKDGNSSWLLFNQQEHIDFARKHANPKFLPPDAPRAFENYRNTGELHWLDFLPKEYADERKKMVASEDVKGTRLPKAIWDTFEQKYLTRGTFLDFYLTSLLRPDLAPGVTQLEHPTNYPEDWHRRYNDFYQRSRYLAVTETGRLGMVSVPAAVGDLIVIFKGFAVPMILSPPNYKRDRAHIIVSDAYFLGWMQGEAYGSPIPRLNSFILI